GLFALDERLGEVAQTRKYRERRGLTEAAQRRELDDLREPGDLRGIERTVEHRDQPRRSFAARRALATRLARVEGDQRAHRVADRGAVPQRDDAARARIHAAARDQRLVALPRRNHPSRPAAAARG